MLHRGTQADLLHMNKSKAKLVLLETGHSCILKMLIPDVRPHYQTKFTDLI